MKLIIPRTKEYWYTHEIDATDDDKSDMADEFNSIHTTLDNMNVNHSFDVADDFCTLTIYEQKCQLDEFNMNTLFFFFLMYFDFSIRYLTLGGAGCEFAIELTWKQHG